MITKELKEKYKKINQEELNDQFIDACQNDDLGIVQYLLTGTDLKEHADIHADNDYGFRWACSDGQLEIVKYLILDMSIEKTKHIEDYLNKNQDNKCVKEAIELFKISQLNTKLNANLEHKEKKNKLKI